MLANYTEIADFGSVNDGFWRLCRTVERRRTPISNRDGLPSWSCHLPRVVDRFRHLYKKPYTRNKKNLLRHFERQFKVLSSVCRIELIEVESLGNEVVDEGTESHSVCPGRGKIGHTHILNGISTSNIFWNTLYPATLLCTQRRRASLIEFWFNGFGGPAVLQFILFSRFLPLTSEMLVNG